MRLLTKQEVQEKESAQRKLAIDEGVSLARKVDGLREQSLKAEAGLAQFHTVTVAETLDEITGYIKRRDEVKEELAELELARNEVMTPLLVKEAEVDRKIEAQQKKDVELEAREDKLSLAESAQITKDRELLLKESALDTEKNMVMQTLVDARLILADAKAYEQDVNQNAHQFSHQAVAKEEELRRREGAVELREKSAELREGRIIRDKEEIIVRTRQLDDAYATLERNKQRDG